MNDLKLYGKTMQELDSLVQTVRIFSSDKGMLEIRRGKVVQSEGIELPREETINH